MKNFAYSLRNKTVQLVIAISVITSIIDSPMEMQEMLHKIGIEASPLQSSWILLLWAVWIVCLYFVGKDEREKVENNEK